MVASEKGRRRLRVSKNRKKNWGKHCDIKDVEEFLEEKRFDERTGGPVSEKKAEELFCIDIGKDEGLPIRKKLKGPLRCHQLLQDYSKVPVPVNPLKGAIGKKGKEALHKASEKKLQRAASRLSQNRHPKEKSAASRSFHDLWGQDEPEEKDSEIKDLIEYRDEITKKRPVKVPSHLYKKPSLLPSVEVPHPGASYNPSYKAHQDLLSKALQVEVKRERGEMHLKRVLTDMFPTKADAPTEATKLAEMSQGLFDENEEAKQNEEIPIMTNPPVTDENRKTRSQRTKQKQIKNIEREKVEKKRLKKEMNEVYRLKNIKTEIKQAEEVSKQRQEKRQQKKHDRMYQPHILGSQKYEAPDMEVNLSEELRGSLRELKVEGSILEDRYKSLQRRNIIEPRVKRRRPRKYKLKIQVKRSHRNFE